METSTGNLLLVGEGDFSFSVSLANKLRSDCHITATSLLNTKGFIGTHALGQSNVDRLRQMGADVYFEVDATQLQQNTNLKDKLFDRIIFNFPHVGGKSNIKKNRQLLCDFFQSASHCLKDNGDILVTLCRGQGGTPIDKPVRLWGDCWQVLAMAAVSHFVMFDIQEFSPLNYPEYNCTGYRNRDCEFLTESAHTHFFRRCPVSCPPNKTISIDQNNIPYLATKLQRPCLRSLYHPVRLIYNALVHHMSTTHSAVNDLGYLSNPVVDKTTLKRLPISCLYWLAKVPSSTALDLSVDNTPTSLAKSVSSQRENECSTENNTQNLPTNGCQDWRYLRSSIAQSSELRGLVRSITAGHDLRDAVVSIASADVYKRQVTPCSDPPLTNQAVFVAATKCDSFHQFCSLCLQTLSIVLSTASNVSLAIAGSSDNPFLDSRLFGVATGQISFVEVGYDNSCASYMTPCNQVGAVGKPAIETAHTDKRTKFCTSVACVLTLDGNIGDAEPALDSGDDSWYDLHSDTTNVQHYLCIIDLDCLAQICYAIPDKRLLYSTNSYVAQQLDGKSLQDIIFKQVSMYPPLWRHDLSFWLPDHTVEFDERQLLDIIREVTGDTAKTVLRMNVWQEPETGRWSRCYRVVYQSADSALSHDLAHSFQNCVRLTVAERLGVVLR